MAGLARPRRRRSRAVRERRVCDFRGAGRGHARCACRLRRAELDRVLLLQPVRLRIAAFVDGDRRADRSRVVVPGRPRVLHSPVAAHFRITLRTGGHTGAVPSRPCRPTPARPLVPAGRLRTGAARPGERAAVRVPDSAHGLPGSAAADPGAEGTSGCGWHLVQGADFDRGPAVARGLVHRLWQSDPAVPHARHPVVGTHLGAGCRHHRRRAGRHVAPCAPCL